MRDLLRFVIARDTMHHNQWLAAIEQPKEDGAELLPVPSNVPQSEEHEEVSCQHQNSSDGSSASEDRWASGPSIDGKGGFT